MSKAADLILMFSVRLSRRLGYILPLALLAIIAVNGRTQVAPWQYSLVDHELEANLEAYALPVQLVNELKLESDAPPRDEDLRRVANLWIRQSREGILKPFVCSDLSDTTHYGIKDEISRSKMRLAFTITNRAAEKARQRRYDDAASYWMQALELAYVMKYSDFASLTACHSAEKIALRGLASVAPKLSDSAKLVLSRSLKEWQNQDRPLDRMLMRQKRLLAKYCSVNEISYPSGDGLESFSSLASLVKHERATPANMKIMRAAVASSTGEVLGSLCHIKVAWIHEGTVAELAEVAKSILSKGEQEKSSLYVRH